MKITGGKYVYGMGKSINERMREYNQVKDTIQNLSKNKEVDKRRAKAQLARMPWVTVLFIAIICIFAGSVTFYLGINSIKRSLANADKKVYVTARVDYVSSKFNSSGGSELRLEYYVDGKKYQDRVETSIDPNQFAIGQHIQVYYYKGNPYTTYLVSDEMSDYLMPVVGVIFIFTGFGAVFAKVKAGNIKRKI